MDLKSHIVNRYSLITQSFIANLRLSNADQWISDRRLVIDELMSSETLRISIRGNDVIVGPPLAVWNPNEAPNDRIFNWWYADLTADGGYNHFELRRYKRAYTLSGVFQQGQLAPPMEEAGDWIRFDVFGGQ